MFRNVIAPMVWRAGAAAMLAVTVGVSAPQAEEMTDSADPRVRELVEAGQGVLLPLKDALGTAPAVAEAGDSDQDSGASGEPEEAASVAEVDEVEVTETAVPNISSDPVEEIGSAAAEAVEEAVEEWPPPPEDAEAAGLVDDSAVDEILAEDVPDDGDDGELAPQAVEEVTVVEEMVAVEPSAGVPEPSAAQVTDGTADNIGMSGSQNESGAAAVSTAMLTEEPAAETGAAAVSTAEEAAVTEPIVEETIVEETVVGEELVEEPAAPEAEELDAGPVPLKTAELGNPQSIGPFRLWLASYRTVRQAKDGWQELALANPDNLADLTPIIVLKDLGGDEGTFFRLQAGPLQTQASAVDRCEALQAAGLYCSVLGP